MELRASASIWAELPGDQKVWRRKALDADVREIHLLRRLPSRISPIRCSPDDAGVYKAVAKSPLGEAMTFATLVVNCE